MGPMKPTQDESPPVCPRYEIILYWSKDDQAFIAEVPELPGGGRRSNVSGSTGHAETVIQEWIDTVRELGRPIPEPRGKPMFA